MEKPTTFLCDENNRISVRVRCPCVFVRAYEMLYGILNVMQNMNGMIVEKQEKKKKIWIYVYWMDMKPIRHNHHSVYQSRKYDEIQGEIKFIIIF